jgi:protein phosphatase
VGRKRTVNQDSVYRTDQPIGSLPNLYLVADGMGGHNAGDYASRTCVEILAEAVKNSGILTPIGVLQEAINKANEVIYQRSCEDPALEGMGTTLVVATVLGNSMYVANIGDSRLYLLNSGMIRQVTEDHSLVEAMVRNGELQREEARSHPNKNVITRALGTSRSVIADFFEVTLKENDIVLMCTDGLSNMLEDEEILQVVSDYSESLMATAAQLVKEANEHGGKDNIGLVLIRS